MSIAVESSKISSAVLLAALNCKASIFPMYTMHDAAKQIKLTRRKKSSPPQNRSLIILLSLAILRRPERRRGPIFYIVVIGTYYTVGGIRIHEHAS